MRRVIESLDPNDCLLERILSRENMQQAWKRVKVNKGAPGINNISIEGFPEFAREHWNAIRESLSDGSYQPLPVKRVEIPKPSGGMRPLGIPTVTDRLIQQVISQVLVPIFDPSFSRKGPRKCARTLATQTGMTNQWLKDQGLLSVKELW